MYYAIYCNVISVGSEGRSTGCSVSASHLQLLLDVLLLFRIERLARLSILFQEHRGSKTFSCYHVSVLLPAFAPCLHRVSTLSPVHSLLQHPWQRSPGTVLSLCSPRHDESVHGKRWLSCLPVVHGAKVFEWLL